MRIEWHGQSAFSLSGEETTVFIDPFGPEMGELAAEREMQFDYPAIAADEVDLLLVTHEHIDHNGVEAISGRPEMLRATAGTHETQLGAVVGIASEHDDAAGTERGPNTIFVFELDGIRVAHFGDFGQDRLRPEQAAALGRPDLVFLPVGAGPTIGGAAAAAIAAEIGATWVVPMHYRTARTNFLETEADFVAAMPHMQRLDGPSFDTADLAPVDGPMAVVLAAP
jgi:L-ascorbate metabolism protein UlaG (beta-lactamase superfamily)